jgi:hypothetical protein
MASERNLVLRTVYISPELDNKLRASAYDKRTSKNDLIRKYLEVAVKNEEAKIGGSLFTHKSPRMVLEVNTSGNFAMDGQKTKSRDVIATKSLKKLVANTTKKVVQSKGLAAKKAATKK